jgi:2'-5' RNA ligase
MTQNIQKLPGYQVNEYQIILDTHEELRNRIIQVKKEFAEKYHVNNAWGAKPRLTLVKFKQLEMMEERIVNRFKTIAMGFHPIKVELKDFGSFPSHTIYINVTTREPIRGLVRQMKETQRLLKLDNDNKPHFIDEPLFMISRKLQPWQYEKGWLEYSNRHFTGRFIAQDMLLIKRREGMNAYQIVQRFEFMNLPVAIRQGELFA